MPGRNIPPDVLNVDEITTYLRVSKATVCRWCIKGTLPAFRFGRSWRIQRSDLDQYICHAKATGVYPHTHVVLDKERSKLDDNPDQEDRHGNDKMNTMNIGND